MKFKEPKTFRDATSPARMMCLALGLGTFEYPAGCPRRALSIGWSMTYLILLLNLQIFAEQQHFQISNTSSSAFSATHVIFLIADIIYVTFYIYCGQLQSKKMMESVCEFNRVDELLSKLGNPKDYMSIFKHQIIYLIGIFLFVSTMITCELLIIIENVSAASLCSMFAKEYLLIVIFSTDFNFCYYVRCIGKRYQRLNVSVEKLHIEEGNAEPFPLHSFLNRRDPSLLQPKVLEIQVKPWCYKIADQQRITQTLQDAREIHRDLWNLAKKLNDIFGVPILVSMSESLFAITTVLFSIYFKLVTASGTATNIAIEVLYNLVWVFAHAFKAIFIVSACSMASAEAHQMADIIHDLVNPTTSNEIREKIHAFSLEIMQNPLEFTACGLFTLDYGMISAMIQTAITYLVLMVQIRHASNVAPGSTNAPTLVINSTISNSLRNEDRD